MTNNLEGEKHINLSTWTVTFGELFYERLQTEHKPEEPELEHLAPAVSFVHPIQLSLAASLGARQPATTASPAASQGPLLLLSPQGICSRTEVGDDAAGSRGRRWRGVSCVCASVRRVVWLSFWCGFTNSAQERREDADSKSDMDLQGKSPCFAAYMTVATCIELLMLRACKK